VPIIENAQCALARAKWYIARSALFMSAPACARSRDDGADSFEQIEYETADVGNRLEAADEQARCVLRLLKLSDPTARELFGREAGTPRFRWTTRALAAPTVSLHEPSHADRADGWTGKRRVSGATNHSTRSEQSGNATIDAGLLSGAAICGSRSAMHFGMVIIMGWRWAVCGVACVALAARANPRQWDPPAIADHPTDATLANERNAIEIGRRLFITKFNTADGAGRPGATGDSKPTLRSKPVEQRFTRVAGLDANSCFGCHNDPVVGGSGDFVANVFVGAHFSDPPVLSIEAELTSERNTVGLLGAGLVELVAREMSSDLRGQLARTLEQARAGGRDIELALVSKGVSFGSIVVRSDGTYDTRKLEGVDPDLVVKPFGFKGVAISLREFTINALNQHHGIEAVERFGWERTGLADFDADGVEVEFTAAQVTALTLFQSSLAPPRPFVPRSLAQQAARGAALFEQVECSSCHRPALPLAATRFSEPNPFNRPGNLVPDDVDHPISISLPPGTSRSVLAYTDLRRHRICDAEDPFFCNERRRQDNVPTDQFMTPKLWDLATSAPYGHRGDCTTLSEVIVHHSAEGKRSKDLFLRLTDEEKADVIIFLLSLGAAKPQ
jgi:hypothetical protein